MHLTSLWNLLACFHTLSPDSLICPLATHGDNGGRKMLRFVRYCLVLTVFVLISFLVLPLVVSQSAEKAPSAATKSFKITALSDGNQDIADVCEKTTEFTADGKKGKSCYKYEWNPWVKQAYKKVAGQNYSVVEKNAGVETPAEKELEYPDGSRRLVFQACRQHACDEAQVFFLVDAKRKEMDIVVWQSNGKTEYFGPNSKLLKDGNAASLLTKNW
jgi:hypothetical protein